MDDNLQEKTEELIQKYKESLKPQFDFFVRFLEIYEEHVNRIKKLESEINPIEEKRVIFGSPGCLALENDELCPEFATVKVKYIGDPALYAGITTTTFFPFTILAEVTQN